MFLIGVGRFGADERHPIRRADLQAINAFLLSVRDRELTSAPTRERSLQIFGDEKRLDHLRKGKLALFEERISLEDLRCYRTIGQREWPALVRKLDRDNPGHADQAAAIRMRRSESCRSTE